jgi:hypothetical protein
MYYFDAEEDALKEDEYPILFTTSLQHPKPKVSLDQPESMLRKSKGIPEKQESEPLETHQESRYTRQDSDPIRNHRNPSMRFHKIARRPTLEQHNALAKPRIKLTEQGYPGELSFEELAECVSAKTKLGIILLCSSLSIVPTYLPHTALIFLYSKNSCVV